MEVFVLLALILANGLFAMAEIAVISSRHVRLRQLADKGSAGAAAVLAIAANPGAFLSTVQVGITLIGIFMGAFGEATLAAELATSLRDVPAFAGHADQWAIAIVVFGITYFSLVLGELVPKRLALHAPEAIATRIALPMRWLATATLPFVKLLTLSAAGMLRLMGVRESVKQTVTEAEIEALMKIGAEAGVFVRAERDLVSRVLRLDAQAAAAIMTPRGDVVFLDLDEPLTKNLEIIRREGYTRLPVCRGALSNVMGVLNALDLLDSALAGKPIDLTARMRPALAVPETIHVIRLLELFKQNKEQLAFVVDEYGEVQGVVTMTDVMEAIVGELPEAGEPEEHEVVRREDGSLLVDASVSLVRLHEAVGRPIELPQSEVGIYHTLGGLVMARLGRVPRAGDKFTFSGLSFEVLDMDRQRVDKVLVQRLPEERSVDPPQQNPGST